MPKSFTAQEKKAVAEALIEQGRNLFSRYGLQKTSINDITSIVGIAPGTFYKFYSSKEELYFDVLELEEGKIKAQFRRTDLKMSKQPKQALKQLLLDALEMVESNPLIRQLYFDNNMEALLRKLPPERLEAHLANDSDEILLLITKWGQEGVLVEKSPEVIAGLIRGLFMLTMHQKEIGNDVYRDVMEMQVEMIAEGLIRTEA